VKKKSSLENFNLKNVPVIGVVPKKYQSMIREKAISRARTRIIVAGGDPTTFKQEDLEVIVREEEDKIKQDIKVKGFMAVLAMLGLNFLG